MKMANVDPKAKKDFADAMTRTGAETATATSEADFIRTNAQKRLATVAADTASQDARARIGGVILMPETQDVFKNAEKMLEKVREDHAARTEKLHANDSKYLYYVKCREGHINDEHGIPLPQHGVYLTKHPGELPVKASEWFAEYKAADDVKYRGDVLCQVCLRRDAVIPLPIVWTDAKKGEWRPEPRWLWRYDKETGQESRASVLKYDAANSEAPVMAKAV